MNDHSSIAWRALHSDLLPDADGCDRRCVGYTFVEKATSSAGDDVWVYRGRTGYEFAIGPGGTRFKKMEAIDVRGRPIGAPRDAQPWVPVGRSRFVDVIGRKMDGAGTDADAPAYRYWEFEGWTGPLGWGDGEVIPDGHNDWISQYAVLDGNPCPERLAVSIQIHGDALKGDALRLIRKIITAMEEGWQAEALRVAASAAGPSS